MGDEARFAVTHFRIITVCGDTFICVILGVMSISLTVSLLTAGLPYSYSLTQVFSKYL